MEETDEAEMVTEFAGAASVPFQLEFDKSIPFQVKMAEWNPEKDLLAMVTDDSKVLLHRFNWQRLWTICPGKCITSLCWRPDGKAIVLGLEDGSVSLHDVENGKLLRSFKSHSVAVVCLNWEDQSLQDDCENICTYEDRTLRFFPPAPRIPRVAGLGSGDNGLMDESEDTYQDLSTSSRQQFNILCSVDKDGFIFFSTFGMFPLGKINIHKLPICTYVGGEERNFRLHGASISKVALSKDLCKLTVLTYGELVGEVVSVDKSTLREGTLSDSSCSLGLHCLCIDTSVFLNRKNELHQVALQASNIDDLLEVVRSSLSLMTKQWSEAMNFFHVKFDQLSSLIVNYGVESSSQEELLSLLLGARTSPPLHQFLVNTLGELGLKRASKAIDGAGKELQQIIHEHLQPAVEIIGFRMGELRALSKWRFRFQGIGLDEKLIDDATEKAGMLLVQVERFLRVLTVVLCQFQNFFIWLQRCINILKSETADHIPSQPYNSEHIIIFLKFLYDHDPVGLLLELYEVNQSIEVDQDTMQRLKHLVEFGGFSDTNFLERSLVREYSQLEESFKKALIMPFTTISSKLLCEKLLPMYPIPSRSMFQTPISVAYCEGSLDSASCGHASQIISQDVICLKIPDESVSMKSCVGILKGFTSRTNSTEAVLLSLPDDYYCVDLSLYKENQVILLLNEANPAPESPGRSLMMMLQINDFSFCSVADSFSSFWKLLELEASTLNFPVENGKVRAIPNSVTPPLAVSASRGLACLFTSRRHALVYILDEDEVEVSDME